MVATKRSKGMTPSKTHTPPMCRGISLHSKLRNAASSAPKRAGSWGSAMTASLRETRILRLYCLVIHRGMQGVQGAARGKGKVNRLAEIVAAHEKHGRNINRGAVPLDRGPTPSSACRGIGKSMRHYARGRADEKRGRNFIGGPAPGAGGPTPSSACRGIGKSMRHYARVRAPC